MKQSKKNVGIIFGGQSAEHEISIKSTQAVYNNLDKKRYNPIFIYISREKGRWHIINETDFNKKSFLNSHILEHSFLPWENDGIKKVEADIYFPMLHGPNGEDGKIQSLLELAGKPYVGANSFTSALAMDKVISKILFQRAGLHVADYLAFQYHERQSVEEEIHSKFSFPVFVKPSAMGSSVGITKVKDDSLLKSALDLAFKYDSKVLVEKAIDMRELEVSVMGNEEILISQPGELIPFREFYDYEDKYIDGKTLFNIPASLEPNIETQVRQIAGKAYQTLGLNGMSRVDLFLENETNKIYVNEINTIPGFTEISMFPKLWKLQGISFAQLITRLIDYGFQYHQRFQASTERIPTIV